MCVCVFHCSSRYYTRHTNECMRAFVLILNDMENVRVDTGGHVTRWHALWLARMKITDWNVTILLLCILMMHIYMYMINKWPYVHIETQNVGILFNKKLYSIAIMKEIFFRILKIKKTNLSMFSKFLGSMLKLIFRWFMSIAMAIMIHSCGLCFHCLHWFKPKMSLVHRFNASIISWIFIFSIRIFE